MSFDTTPEIEEFRDEMILSMIKKTGWAVIACREGVDSPPFAYTIGLVEKFNHPEIILFGIPNPESTKVLNEMGEHIKSGKKFSEANKLYDGLLPSTFSFMQVDHEKDNWLGYASWYYKREFPAIQCVWADSKDLWPWNKDCDPNVAKRQLILNEEIRNHIWLESEYYPTGVAVSTTVRRYLTLDKFQKLITDEAIYFRNVTLFAEAGDGFEGSTPGNLLKFYQQSFAEFSAQSVPNAGAAAYLERQRVVRTLAMLHSSYVNCWFAGAHESAGMWTGYAKDSANPGVAIESTYDKLVRSFADELPSDYFFINYVDFDSADFKSGELRYKFATQPLSFKRIEYKDESELRLLVSRPEEAAAQLSAGKMSPVSSGFNLKVNLQELLAKVIIGPKASDGFISEVQAALKTKGISVPIVKSALDNKPVY